MFRWSTTNERRPRRGTAGGAGSARGAHLRLVGGRPPPRARRRWFGLPGRAARRAGRRVLVVAAVLACLVVAVASSPWPPGPTLRHVAAAPNCAAARLVGLAPATPGRPGYYRRHDADRDGVACEPLRAIAVAPRALRLRRAVSRRSR